MRKPPSASTEVSPRSQLGSVTPLEVSRAADITRETLVIALPVAQGGKTLAVKIGAVELVDILGALDGLPGANVAPAEGRTKPFAEVRAEAIQSVGPAKKIAMLGLLEPAFAFDEREDGKAYWGDLTTKNQGAVVEGIMALSGLDGGAAKQASTFPAGAGSDGQAG